MGASDKTLSSTSSETATSHALHILFAGKNSSSLLLNCASSAVSSFIDMSDDGNSRFTKTVANPIEAFDGIFSNG